MGAYPSGTLAAAFENQPNWYAPLIDKCNEHLNKTIDYGNGTVQHFIEGCIFNGALDTAKSRQECVIDETVINQQAIYCDGCSGDGGCNLVHSFETDSGISDSGIEVSKFAKSCAGAMVDSVSVDTPFCLMKGAWFLNHYGFPSGYGTVIEGYGRGYVPCQYVVGGYLCDGTSASNEASAQHGSVDVDTLVEHAADAAAVKTFVEAAASAGGATLQAVQQAWLNSANNGCSA